MWPEVPLYYQDCVDDEQRLKQRIRRAFEKTSVSMDESAERELAELLYEKIAPLVKGMVP